MKKTWRCTHCGRFFKKPCPHKCKDGFRKHKLTFVQNETTNDMVDAFEGANILLLPDLSDKEQQWMEHSRKLLDLDMDINLDHNKASLDTQVGGDHYKKYKIQPIEFAMVNGLDACQTNILKYIMRHKDKNGKEDLLKARHYLDMMIDYYYPTK